ncbi:endonuclease/exonuclease/phosphatase family protein [Salipiger sp. P9]|uniref:endonuclease/exonuclease/phosphatase family protein n=1 Tax=Salipiger pentaromativorans TaxID=2943193 RepID=UPI00215809AE|nr:endonuclease/exonuclease/phosphatase family protein [Salipiger pentaromativorans]MCR8547207.1 endonuclease/exonuclease/phosphatase family protein [Salipiger pentaromativorans]
MRIASLNMQNLRLLPDETGGHLHGARDRDEAPDTRHDEADRRLTAELLAATGADVLALQEVFDVQSLDFFHDRYLAPRAGRYPYRLCLPGNDGRGLDVALMARRPWDEVTSHAGLTPEDLGLAPPEGMAPAQPVFRRDCLEARFGALTLFVVHFKAPSPEPARAWALRRMEAEAVRRLLPRGREALWLVVGDLNEPRDSGARAIAPLEEAGVDLGLRLPEAGRWTYYEPHVGAHHRPDALIASPALAERFPRAVPRVLHRGLGHEAGPGQGTRLPGVGHHRPHASDHAALMLDLPGL